MAGNTMGHCTVVLFGFLLKLKNRLCQRELNGKNCSCHGGHDYLVTILYSTAFLLNRRAVTSVQVVSSYSVYK
jgi:hypothetical protein